jgi:hypothetical protein
MVRYVHVRIFDLRARMYHKLMCLIEGFKSEPGLAEGVFFYHKTSFAMDYA